MSKGQNAPRNYWEMYERQAWYAKRQKGNSLITQSDGAV